MVEVVHAEPQKTFFVDMFTKDIGLGDCVLDLIDNSIHSLITTANIDITRTLTGRTRLRLPGDPKIDLNFDSKRFVIRDNCGGIKKIDAINDVFLFGRRKQPEQKPGLGIYGVGMKRALFKLGRKIQVISRTNGDMFRVPIDVDEWRKTDDWSFPLEDMKNGSVLKKPGVYIEVTQLNDLISKRLGSPAFKGELVDKISTAYALFMDCGLGINVNAEQVPHTMPEFETQSAKPARKEMRVEDVSVLIMAGLTPKFHREPEGWYVFCNGRLLLARDQSTKTGWGVDGFPQFHSKFNHFLGTVYFTSRDLEKLPWTTTKREVDEESPIYQEVLTEMKIIARSVLNELAKLYPTDKDDEAIVQREIFLDSKSTPVTKLPHKESLFRVTPVRTTKPTETTITYRKPVEIVKKVKMVIGRPYMSNKEVGEYTFQYFVEKECE